MPTKSNATVKVVPHQHIPPAKKQFDVEANYHGAAVPNDVHLHYRKLTPRNDGDWLLLSESSFGGMGVPLPYKPKYFKPTEPGTYDIRVIFTLDGNKLDDGERIGQFFVD